MSLIQSESRDAAIDRIGRKLVAHCGLLSDDLPASEKTARHELATRLLDAAGGDESLVDFDDPAFAVELLTLSLNKRLT